MADWDISDLRIRYKIRLLDNTLAKPLRIFTYNDPVHTPLNRTEILREGLQGLWRTAREVSEGVIPPKRVKNITHIDIGDTYLPLSALVNYAFSPGALIGNDCYTRPARKGLDAIVDAFPTFRV